MAKFTAKSYDMCAVGGQDNSFCVSATGGAAGFALTITHDSTNIIYITGIIITSNNPASNASGVVTLSGLTTNSSGGTMSLVLMESSTTGGQLDLSIVDPIPSKDTVTDVVLTVPAIASGASSVAITLLGYRRPE